MLCFFKKLAIDKKILQRLSENPVTPATGDMFDKLLMKKKNRISTHPSVLNAIVYPYVSVFKLFDMKLFYERNKEISKIKVW